MKLFSRVVLPILLIIYIAIETYAKLNNSPICTSTGCNLAGELLKFNSVYLNYFGALGALFIALFGYLSLKKEAFEKLFFITLYAAIAFESIMIAYQIIANPEPCSFCLGVYGGLLFIALMSQWRYLLYALPAIAALFISMSFLAMTENRSIIKKDGNYLIGSDKCPYCKKSKEYFKEKGIPYKILSIYDTNARFFIKQLDINSIPVLVIKKNDTSIVIKGYKAITSHFNKAIKSANTPETKSTPKGIYNSADEGCSASILQDSGCSESPSVPLR
ncbi:MAG: hypothetical protein HF962_08875 [Sulfurovum sp.]|nr:hypothetical protein [Sulfurovum sp.]